MTLLLALALTAAQAAPLPWPFFGGLRQRNLECDVLDPQLASERYPGRINAPRPRGDYVARTVIACQERLFAPGVRPPREDAVLSDLDARTAALAQRAATVTAPGRTWMVEANDVSGPLTAKIRFATQNALMAEGLAVSDRLPRLAPADMYILGRRPPLEAWPAACVRYAATGTLGPTDALLVVTALHPSETNLHAGVCLDGAWRWLQ